MMNSKIQKAESGKNAGSAKKSVQTDKKVADKKEANKKQAGNSHPTLLQPAFYEASQSLGA